MKVKLLFLSILLLGMGIAVVGVTMQHQPISAPDAIFTTISGETISLKELQGKPVLITFWATNCKPCLEEIPQLIRLHNTYYQQGLQIIAVSMHYDQPNRVVNMSKERHIPYHLALDIRNEHAIVFGDVQLIPYAVLISPDGYIDMQITGLIDMQQLTQRIEFFLPG